MQRRRETPTHERLRTWPPLSQGSPAITALWSRIIERSTELETKRTEISEGSPPWTGPPTGHQDDPGLLDALPMLGDALSSLPVSIQARLFAAFGLELIYNKQDHQVTIYATITPSTPQALAAIIAGSEPPKAPAEPAGLAHSLQHPRVWSVRHRPQSPGAIAAVWAAPRGGVPAVMRKP